MVHDPEFEELLDIKERVTALLKRCEDRADRPGYSGLVCISGILSNTVRIWKQGGRREPPHISPEERRAARPAASARHDPQERRVERGCPLD